MDQGGKHLPLFQKGSVFSQPFQVEELPGCCQWLGWSLTASLASPSPPPSIVVMWILAKMAHSEQPAVSCALNTCQSDRWNCLCRLSKARDDLVAVACFRAARLQLLCASENTKSSDKCAQLMPDWLQLETAGVSSPTCVCVCVVQLQKKTVQSLSLVPKCLVWLKSAFCPLVFSPIQRIPKCCVRLAFAQIYANIRNFSVCCFFLNWMLADISWAPKHGK